MADVSDTPTDGRGDARRIIVARGLPLLIGGALKVGYDYDLTLWRIFRRVPMPAAFRR